MEIELSKKEYELIDQDEKSENEIHKTKLKNEPLPEKTKTKTRDSLEEKFSLIEKDFTRRKTGFIEMLKGWVKCG